MTRTGKASRRRLPRVTLKIAQTLDGRIATSAGESQWITSEPSRRLAHRLRAEHDAVLVGIGTVLKDDPMLTVRHVKGSDPLRVVVDSRLRTPLTAKLLLAGGSGGTLLFTGSEPKPAVVRRFEDLGAEVVRVPHEHGTGVDLASVLSELGHRGVKSVLVEGGAKIVTSFLKSRLAHRMVIIIAPKIIGDGREAIGDLEITRLRDAIRLTSCSVRRLGSDVVIDGKLN